MIRKGDKVTIKAEHRGPGEPAIAYTVVGEDLGDGIVQIEPVEFTAGPFKPIEAIRVEMLEAA